MGTCPPKSELYVNLLAYYISLQNSFVISTKHCVGESQVTVMSSFVVLINRTHCVCSTTCIAHLSVEYLAYISLAKKTVVVTKM